MEFKISTFNINLAVSLLLITIMGGQIYWLVDYEQLSFLIAFTDSFVCYLLIYGIFLFIRYSPSFYASKYFKYGIVDLQGLILTFAWVYASKFLLNEIFKTPKYEAVWEHTLFIRGLIGWILMCFFITVHLFASEFEKYKTYAEKETISEQLRKEAELFKLRQQLQPHFLFNSLNSINALIGKQPKEARVMVQQLSDYLRNNMKKEDNDQVSIQDEIDDLKRYLSIELVRFGHRLSIKEKYEIATPEDFMPPFLIQPLVENAIKFGLYGTIGEVEIEISAKQAADTLLFQICNPYDVSNVTPKGTGFGLASIRRRLYLLYSRNDLLNIKQYKNQAGQDYYCVSIEIPLFTSQNPVNTLEH